MHRHISGILPPYNPVSNDNNHEEYVESCLEDYSDQVHHEYHPENNSVEYSYNAEESLQKMAEKHYFSDLKTTCVNSVMMFQEWRKHELLNMFTTNNGNHSENCHTKIDELAKKFKTNLQFAVDHKPECYISPLDGTIYVDHNNESKQKPIISNPVQQNTTKERKWMDYQTKMLKLSEICQKNVTSCNRSDIDSERIKESERNIENHLIQSFETEEINTIKKEMLNNPNEYNEYHIKEEKQPNNDIYESHELNERHCEPQLSCPKEPYLDEISPFSPNNFVQVYYQPNAFETSSSSSNKEPEEVPQKAELLINDKLIPSPEPPYLSPNKSSQTQLKKSQSESDFHIGEQSINKEYPYKQTANNLYQPTPNDIKQTITRILSNNPLELRLQIDFNSSKSVESEEISQHILRSSENSPIISSSQSPELIPKEFPQEIDRKDIEKSDKKVKFKIEDNEDDLENSIIANYLVQTYKNISERIDNEVIIESNKALPEPDFNPCSKIEPASDILSENRSFEDPLEEESKQIEPIPASTNLELEGIIKQEHIDFNQIHPSPSHLEVDNSNVFSHHESNLKHEPSSLQSNIKFIEEENDPISEIKKDKDTHTEHKAEFDNITSIFCSEDPQMQNYSIEDIAAKTGSKENSPIAELSAEFAREVTSPNFPNLSFEQSSSELYSKHVSSQQFPIYRSPHFQESLESPLPSESPISSELPFPESSPMSSESAQISPQQPSTESHIPAHFGTLEQIEEEPISDHHTETQISPSPNNPSPNNPSEPSPETKLSIHCANSYNSSAREHINIRVSEPSEESSSNDSNRFFGSLKFDINTIPPSDQISIERAIEDSSSLFSKAKQVISHNALDENENDLDSEHNLALEKPSDQEIFPPDEEKFSEKQSLSKSSNSLNQLPHSQEIQTNIQFKVETSFKSSKNQQSEPSLHLLSEQTMNNVKSEKELERSPNVSESKQSVSNENKSLLDSNDIQGIKDYDDGSVRVACSVRKKVTRKSKSRKSMTSYSNEKGEIISIVEHDLIYHKVRKEYSESSQKQ